MVKRIWQKCPLCEAKSVRLRCRNVSVKVRDVVIVVPHLEYYECTNCHEEFFDYEASKRVDNHCFSSSLSGNARRKKVSPG